MNTKKEQISRRGSEGPKILFVSGELIGADLCHRLKREGCDVKLYIEDQSRSDCFENIVKKTKNWEKELDWVGKDGLIIFDDVGYGKEQDRLRKEGYQVVGGSAEGDRLEKDRQYAQKIFADYEMDIVGLYSFNDIDSAIDFIKDRGGKWVVKQDGHTSFLTYVGEMEDGSDVINVLKNYKDQIGDSSLKISLQKKVEGVEVGVGRYFNGNDWIGPIEFNLEHKNLFNGGIGPQTGEMGTVMWYDKNEDNKLFQKSLAKLKPYLQDINFKGDVEINFIVNKDKAVPLEATMRFGCPSTQLQAAIHKSPWNEFLLAVAKGEQYDLKYEKGEGIIVSVAIPPFPYPAKFVDKSIYLKGADIFFKEKFTGENWNNIHFEEVSLRKSKNVCYYISGSNGYILYVSGIGNDVDEARKKTYSLIDKIIIPKMFYRTDIGQNFIKKDKQLLKKWGWIR